jgi:hypothetical protein
MSTAFPPLEPAEPFSFPVAPGAPDPPAPDMVKEEPIMLIVVLAGKLATANEAVEVLVDPIVAEIVISYV